MESFTMAPVKSFRSPDASANQAELLQRSLTELNAQRLTPTLPPPVSSEPSHGRGEGGASEAHESGDEALHHAAALGRLRLEALERQFVEAERRRIRPLLVDACVPTEAAAFVQWFETLEATGPGQHDPLFDWLEHEATLEQMRWFLRQEVAGEAGFEDLVALTQVKMPAQAKLELARNYWDELGQGHAGGMHGPMLGRLAEELGLGTSGDALREREREQAGGANENQTPVVWESLALANLLVALASHRHYAYLSIGALGAVELTAPGRATKVNAGLKRLGVRGEARRYFALHATLDVKHSEAWNREVLAPMVAADPRLAPAIAEGALLRLAAGQRCFERYRRELAVPPIPTTH